MKVGIACLATGPFATGDFIRRSAQAAERAGFASYWLGEHILLFGSYPGSTYPYGGVTHGESPIRDPRSPMFEPLMAMCWAAAATQTIEIGTSVLVLPQHNPVLLAKEISCLDSFSEGRITLGVGLGWCREEMEAIGFDWASRGRRTDEYIAAMRALWRGDPADFQGETIAFADAYMYPRPVRDGTVPIMIGGTSDAALRRVARCGDGWLAYAVPQSDAPARVTLLKQLTRDAGRDPDALRISMSIFSATTGDDLKRYRDAGITEFLLFNSGEIAVREPELSTRMGRAADHFLAMAADL